MALTTVKPHPFETVPSGEADQIRETAEIIVQLLQRRYPKSVGVRRGVHPKDHGCVRAMFEVNADLAPELQVGVFATPGRKYDAWIRFSNAAAVVGPDLVPGADDQHRHGSRGMAIKLMGVDGPSLVEHQGATTQDFLMINSPAFTFANVGDYLALNKGLLANNDDSRLAFGTMQSAIGGTPEGVARVKRSAMLIAKIQAAPLVNPLEGRYFSAAPFLFGDDRVMHYAARAVVGTPSMMPQQPSDTYLREALSKRIAAAPAEFDFEVQIRGPKDDLAIEDATAEWDENVTTFRKVARITVPVQEPDTGAARTICEELFFSPWHCVKEHQPLGGINRLRNEVYVASSMHRHHPKEPAGREWF